MGKFRTNSVQPSVGKGISGYMRYIRAEWPGGAYVDLTFIGPNPSEVINVYDYRMGEYDLRVHTPKGLREIVREWAKVQDEEWPEWYEVYVENSRF